MLLPSALARNRTEGIGLLLAKKSTSLRPQVCRASYDFATSLWDPRHSDRGTEFQVIHFEQNCTAFGFI
jgi:hypothetical protein